MDLEFLQLRCWADPRKCEKLWGVEDTPSDIDFAGGVGGSFGASGRRSMPWISSILAFALKVFNTDRLWDAFRRIEKDLGS